MKITVMAAALACLVAQGVSQKKFTRWVSTGKTEGRFETSIVTYTDKKGRSVDLVGAVHVGDKAYYKTLQKEFEAYDGLLYELVAKKGTRPDPNRKSSSLISMLQRVIKDVLELQFQLDGIDYSRKNFVHADLDPRRFFKKQKEKGESFTTIILRSMLISLRRQRAGKGPKVTELHLLAALMSKDRGRYLKFLFAQELENLEQMLAAFGGPKASASVIVGERNKEAMRVLDEQLAAGKKKLGIFYGAAHLPDMADRLVKRGFKKAKTRWLTAWNCEMTPAERAEAKRVAAVRAKRLAARAARRRAREKAKKNGK